VHELGIAQEILARVQATSARRGGVRVSRVGLRIGELAGVDPGALSFGIEVLVKDTPLEPLALDIEYCARRQRCPACSREFEVVNWETACPQCGRRDTLTIGGDELDIAFMEVEDQ
jgi:hydrogenase nickel incorporation protein HypA/HybF